VLLRGKIIPTLPREKIKPMKGKYSLHSKEKIFPTVHREENNPNSTQTENNPDNAHGET
jgi:hypothetical protein